ncbi:MAG: hypothetical protein U0869_07980 [Chloroflexota bacterium]
MLAPRRRWLLPAFLLLAALVAPAPVLGAGPAPAGVSQQIAAGNYLKLSMAVDSAGAVHIAATQLTASASRLVYLTDRTGSWTLRVVSRLDAAATDGAMWQDPSLALDENDRVSIAAARISGATGCICSDGIFSWSDLGRTRGTFPATPTRLTVRGARAPQLKTLGGHTYLAFMKGWEHYADAGNHGEVWYKTDASGSWTTVRIAHGQEVQPPIPSLRLTDSGRARIAWPNDGIRLAFASTITGGFTVGRIPNTTKVDRDPQVVLSSEGLMQVAFRRGNVGTMLFQTAPDGASTHKVSGHLGTLAITIDASDIPHVAIGSGSGGVWVVTPEPSSRLISSGAAWDVAVRAPTVGGLVVAWTGKGADRGVWFTHL